MDISEVAEQKLLAMGHFFGILLTGWFLLFLLSAEFIINLAEKHPTFDCFKAALLKNGADFTVSPKENENQTRKAVLNITMSHCNDECFPGLARHQFAAPHSDNASICHSIHQ